jgi:hypothetical protein
MARRPTTKVFHLVTRPTTMVFHVTTTTLPPCHPPCDLDVMYGKLPKFHNFSKFFKVFNFPKMHEIQNLFFGFHGSYKINIYLANFGPVHVNSTSAPEIQHSLIEFLMNFTAEIGAFPNFT